MGKRVFGGDRPLQARVPVGRRPVRVPASPSFPSGHSASAAAFAVGAALESPRAGAVLGPLAAAVAYSRLHIGVHWLSDVLGGASLGAGAALVGKAAVPARPRRYRVSERTVTPALAPDPLGDGARLLLVLNPGSGRDSDRPDPEPPVRRLFPRATLRTLEGEVTIADLVRSAREDGVDLQVLGVHGGDGTVAQAAQVAREEDLTLLVLPGGTMNHFAKAVGCSTLEEALGAAAEGTRRAVDIAELVVGDGEPVTVLNTVSIGVYPDFVEARERHERRIGKPAAAVLAAIRVVAGSDPIELRIGSRRVRAWSFFVGVDSDHPRTATPLARRRLDDGLLDVRILHAGDRPRTRGAIALVLGRLAAPVLRRAPRWGRDPVVESFSTTGIDVRAREVDGDEAGYAHDGETGDAQAQRDSEGFVRARVRVVPRALRVYTAEGRPRS